jgi:tRNA(fMet)-specific endonuclease VapC
MKYLLDTNICIYIIKNKPPVAQERFGRERLGDIAISAVSMTELYYGAQKSSQIDKNIVSIQKFLQPLIALQFNLVRLRKRAV